MADFAADPAPRLVMVAGPNGSGKTTLVDALRALPQATLPALYINADNLQGKRGIADPREAQQLASQLRAEAIAARKDVMYETVMSHPSKIAELQNAKAVGYHITVLLVATSDPDINVARVALRVASGGHDVPEDRTRERYGHTLQLAPIALGYADQAAVFDNSQRGGTGRGLSQQAALDGDRMVLLDVTPADWVERLGAQVNERAAELRGFASGAQALAPQLARLDGGRTSGPFISIGRHYALQYDEPTGRSVLHDRALLEPQGRGLAVRQTCEIRYREGVATVRVPRKGRG